MDQTKNNLVPSQIIDNNNENFQHTSNVGTSNTNLNTLYINTPAPAPQNTTFEFYLPLPNDTRIYHVTYTELDSTEIAQRLNNRIDLSHIPSHHFPHHYHVQSLIQQRIVQSPVDDQQNTIQQQFYNTQPVFQEYSVNNSYDATLNPSIPINGTSGFYGVSFNNQPVFQEYPNNNACDATLNSPIPPNGTIPEDTSGFGGVQSHQNN